MAVITFKFDESYKAPRDAPGSPRTWIVGGWIAGERQWRKLQQRWLKALAYENRTLPDGRKITRYHAAEMNANDGEFKGWASEGYRKLRLTKKLLRIVSSNQLMTAVAVGLDMKAFLELFPDRDPPDHSIAYLLCMQQIMLLIGKAMQQFPPEVRVAMVHEHNDWDGEILAAFNRMIDDPEFEYRHRFVSMTPMNWRSDVGLQSADLIAYELMRRLDDQLWTGGDMRKPLRELLSLNDGGVAAGYMDRTALAKFKEWWINEINKA